MGADRNHLLLFDAERTPRTYQENGESLMSWHYHNAEPSFAKQQANDMVTHLTGGPLSNTSTELIDQSSIITVRPLGVSKGIAAETIFDELQELGYDALTQQKTEDEMDEYVMSSVDQERLSDCGCWY